MLKEQFQFRPALVKPLCPGRDSTAIEHGERVGERFLAWQGGHFRKQRACGRGRTTREEEKGQGNGELGPEIHRSVLPAWFG